MNNLDFLNNTDNLMSALEENIIEDIKTFEDIIVLNSSMNREIYIGDICSGLGQTVEGYIRFWNRYDELKNIPVEEREPIKLYIDSNGGCLTDTFTIIDAIEMSKTPIWTIVSGCAYSGGFFIAITKNAKRIAYPKSSFMFHEGATSTGGDAHKFVNYTSFYKKELGLLKDHVLKYTNLADNDYEAIKRDDYWLTAQEALEQGMIDEIAKEFI